MRPSESEIFRIETETREARDPQALINVRRSRAGDPKDRGPLRPPMSHGRQRVRAERIINGAVVKERRKRLGLTQLELGIMAAAHPGTIAKIERGISLDPPTSTTLRIAKALSVTVEALCAGAQPYTSREPRPVYHDPGVGR